MNELRLKSRSCGFSMLELVVVVVLIGILLVVALWKLSGFVREAERVAVLTLEGEIRNALVMETAKRILNPGGPTVLSLAHSNPMDLMLETPVNYLGRLDGVMIQDVPGRHWFFDISKSQLVYRTGSGFTETDEGGHDIHYDVRIAFSDLDGDGDFSAAHDRLLGVRLHRLGGDKWLNRSSPVNRIDRDRLGNIAFGSIQSPGG